MLTFLGSIKQRTIFGCVSDLNDLSTSEKLHNKTRRHDGGNTQLHQRTCASVTTTQLNIIILMPTRNQAVKQMLTCSSLPLLEARITLIQ